MNNMPYATAPDGTRLYYETHGRGDPLLLIMGLAMDATGWHRNVPDLAAHFRVVVFDNRGVGRSDKPDRPYSMAQMAGDAAAVLDSLAIDSAHVLGISMGGYIAQEFALGFPGRLRKLVLGCTAPAAAGRPHTVPPGREVIQLLWRADWQSREQALRASVPVIYAPETIARRPDLIEADIAQRLRFPFPAHGYLRQLQASLAHDAWDRLLQAAAPTLVLHGGADRLVPAGNAHLLAGRIPGATLAILPDLGHMFFSEAADLFTKHVVAFLQSPPTPL